MDLLEVKNISKTYGNGEVAVHALKQATFSVPKGEFVAVVGAVSYTHLDVYKRQVDIRPIGFIVQV